MIDSSIPGSSVGILTWNETGTARAGNRRLVVFPNIPKGAETIDSRGRSAAILGVQWLPGVRR